MAKKSFGNIADDFITKDINSNTEVEMNNAINKKSFGRPRAKDLEGEKVRKLGVYITENQFRKLNIYSANNDMDKSEAIRHIINRYFEEEYK